MAEDQDESAEEVSNKEKLKEKLKEQGAKNTSTVDFKIYDVPVELKNKYISMAKLHYDNHVWKVLADGMDLLIEERESRVDQLESRVETLEARLEQAEKRIEHLQAKKNNEQNERSKTLGGGPPASDKEKLQDLVDED